jgi:enolase-phosphatase E1
MKLPANIQHVLLDIEGTTCPVNFVSEVLFPYAKTHLLSYLQDHESEESLQRLIAEVESQWRHDSTPEARALAHALQQSRIEAGTPQSNPLTPEEACIYLDWLIQQDRKSTPLKDLQGLIWEQGYRQRQLIAPLFEDVLPVLQRWHREGLGLSVYSSGSVQAQKLLYAHTNVGDLTAMFHAWFDTRTGPKNEPSSYSLIAQRLQTSPRDILFVSDSPAELIAASSAQLIPVFSQRTGNAAQAAEGFALIQTFFDFK